MVSWQFILTIIAVIFGNGWIWNVIHSRFEKKSDTHRLLMGLCFERLVDKCEFYISQGWIPVQEYEDLVEYLYDPYIKCGGNGTAKALMQKVSVLPNKKG